MAHFSLLARLGRLKSLILWMESTGAWAPWCFLALFLAASFLMIWRLEAMNRGGVEGTVLGTLVMPYCSGMGNLIFAFVVGAKGGPGAEVGVGMSPRPVREGGPPIWIGGSSRAGWL